MKIEKLGAPATSGGRVFRGFALTALHCLTATLRASTPPSAKKLAKFFKNFVKFFSLGH